MKKYVVPYARRLTWERPLRHGKKFRTPYKVWRYSSRLNKRY